MNIDLAEKFMESLLRTHGIVLEEVNVLILAVMILSAGFIAAVYWYTKIRCSAFSCKRIILSFDAIDKSIKTLEKIEIDIAEANIREEDIHSILKEKVVEVERLTSDVKASIYQLHGILLGSQSAYKRSIIHEKD